MGHKFKVRLCLTSNTWNVDWPFTSHTFNLCTVCFCQCMFVWVHVPSYFRSSLKSARETLPCMIWFTRIDSYRLCQHVRYAGIFVCQLPLVTSWVLRPRGVSVPLSATPGESGGNGGRRTTAALGMVHFSPEAEGGPLVTLMDRNAAHPPTHTHTPTHVPHTQALTQQLTRCWSCMDTHTQRRRLVHTWSHTGCSVPADLISNAKCLRPAHAAFLPCR